MCHEHSLDISYGCHSFIAEVSLQLARLLTGYNFIGCKGIEYWLSLYHHWV